MMVKICGITSLEDALAAVRLGASALGFNFYPPSPRYISPDDARPILEALPASVWKVGIFVNQPPEAALGLARRLSLDVVQIHGDVPLPEGIRVWKALPVTADFDPRLLHRFQAEAFLLDAPAGAAHGGTGRSFDWSLAAGIPLNIVLAGGLDASNVQDAIRAAHPWGVDACSRLESSPGRKDHAKMADFLKAALAVQL